MMMEQEPWNEKRKNPLIGTKKLSGQMEKTYKKMEDNSMKSFSYVIKDEVGLHARPAGLLAKEAKKYASKITLEAGGKSAEATKLMAIMAMGVKKDTEVMVTIEGDDEDVAAQEIQKFFEENL